jgi:uncharacterized membrane protein YhaH (DUF805 family)
VSITEAVKSVLTQYVGFTGRARRSEYWYWVLAYFVVYLVVMAIDAVLGTNAPGYLLSLAALLPGLAVAVRRLHDTGRSGWWLLIGLIPLVGGIILIVFCATEGNAGPNAYGPDPKRLQQYIA